MSMPPSQSFSPPINKGGVTTTMVVFDGTTPILNSTSYVEVLALLIQARTQALADCVCLHTKLISSSTSITLFYRHVSRPRNVFCFKILSPVHTIVTLNFSRSVYDGAGVFFSVGYLDFDWRLVTTNSQNQFECY
jgi:hypothetical protein